MQRRKRQYQSFEQEIGSVRLVVLAYQPFSTLLMNCANSRWRTSVKPENRNGVLILSKYPFAKTCSTSAPNNQHRNNPLPLPAKRLWIGTKANAVTKASLENLKSLSKKRLPTKR